MLEEFEKAIAKGQSLENTKVVLMRRVENDRTRLLERIEKDFQLCQLIRHGLEEPKNSPQYSLAKGYQNWFRKKHPEVMDDSIVRALRKSTWEDEHRTERTVVNHGNKNGKGGSITEEQCTSIGGSASDEAILSTPIPEIEP